MAETINMDKINAAIDAAQNVNRLNAEIEKLDNFISWYRRNWLKLYVVICLGYATVTYL